MSTKASHTAPVPIVWDDGWGYGHPVMDSYMGRGRERRIDWQVACDRVDRRRLINEYWKERMNREMREAME